MAEHSSKDWIKRGKDQYGPTVNNVKYLGTHLDFIQFHLFQMDNNRDFNTNFHTSIFIRNYYECWFVNVRRRLAQLWRMR